MSLWVYVFGDPDPVRKEQVREAVARALEGVEGPVGETGLVQYGWADDED